MGDDFQGNSDFGDDYEKARGTATGTGIPHPFQHVTL